MAYFASIGQWVQVYRPSLLGAAVFVLALSIRHMGFALILVMLAWILWLPYSIYVVIRHPHNRQSQITRVLIWLIAAVLVAGIHGFRHHTTRQQADTIASDIRDYARQHGHYPATLSEIGMTSSELKETLGSAFYYPRDNQPPHFFYGVTYEPFAVYAYDFERQAWEYIPD